MAVIFSDEPSEYLRPGAELEIFSYFELERILDLADKSRPEIASAITTWARTHPVNEFLSTSIKNQIGAYIAPTVRAQVTA